MLDKEVVKKIALEKGFKLKPQPSGVLDLNPYVYEFAKALEKYIVARKNFKGTAATMKLGERSKIAHGCQINKDGSVIAIAVNNVTGDILKK